jgi:hypothetical protein
MGKNNSVIEDNWSFYVSIQWWEILLGLTVIIFIIYLVKRNPKNKNFKVL